MTYDVIIIGAGVSGCAIARELSRYEAQVLVLDKEEDVCCGTSKANSAIIHAGYDCQPGSLMAKMNVEGNALMGQLCEDLDIPFERNGSLVVCIDKDSLPGIQELYERGLANGVKDLKVLNREETLALEPNLSENTQGALYAPSAGIICPFKLTIALAENANVNGVDFQFETEVSDLKQDSEGLWHLLTSKGEFITKTVVNAAGVYADTFHNLVAEKKIHITPRRGDYFLLDKETGNYVKRTIFPQPTKLGKGILVAPTIHGNTLVGPTAIDVEDKEGVNTTQAAFDLLNEKADMYVKNPPLRKVITSFAGLRAHEDGHEFILGELKEAPGFFDCAGIESPGLSSSPAIGKYLAKEIKEKLSLSEKADWHSKREDIVNINEWDFEKRNAYIKEHPEYGTIICRCESISEGEIIEAIKRPLGARSLDAIKRRTRAGTGRCQGGFCSPKVMDIIARELGIDLSEITKSGSKSKLVCGRTKEVEDA